MLSHATTRDWLIPYADGMLAADERRRIDGHITGCPTCAHELREVRELNLLLVTLPPAPPVAFAPFWLNLQAVLPQRRVLRIPWIQSYRRLGVAFAMAATAALAAGGSAFAAELNKGVGPRSDDAAAELKNPANPKAAKEALHTLHVKLDAVERENASRGDDDEDIKQLVAAANDELDRIEEEDAIATPTLMIGEQATPRPTPQPTVRPTPRPTDKEHGD